jgi:hypothetical protein
MCIEYVWSTHGYTKKKKKKNLQVRELVQVAKLPRQSARETGHISNVEFLQVGKQTPLAGDTPCNVWSVLKPSGHKTRDKCDTYIHPD